jgi:hypothetical protein
MTAKPPPAPSANSSPKGTGEVKTAPGRTGPRDSKAQPDPDHRGRGANIKQNTTNQGYQQDR